MPLLVWQLLFFVAPLCFLVALIFWVIKNFRMVPEFDLVNWVIFVVGDDRVLLSNEAPGDMPNVVVGEIIGEEFVGATATIYMESVGGHEVKAQRSHEELEGVKTSPGSSIFASWRTESGYLLPGE